MSPDQAINLAVREAALGFSRCQNVWQQIRVFPLKAIVAICLLFSNAVELQADYNKLLQLEYKRGISGELTCNASFLGK